MKTTQLLEDLSLETNEPAGVVVANDADRSRAFLLAHTLKRLRSPAFMVVHHDARQIPSVKKAKQEALFDRILCDVPCSGDGTLRKSPDAWAKWTPGGALNLFKTQVGIGLRAAALLKVGGVMVYSTCSFNPSENEAAVAEIVRQAEGTLEIQDMSSRFPALKRAAGMLTWKIMGRDRVIYSSYEECKDKDAKETGLMASMFPPALEEAKAIGLEHCMRLIPSHQDTGGFFIVALKKVKDLKEQVKQVPVVGPGGEKPEICKIYTKHGRCKYGNNCRFLHEDPEDDAPIKAQSSTKGEEPLTQLKGAHQEVLDNIKSFFGFKEDFPDSQLFTRSKDDAELPRHISYVSESIMEILACDVRGRLKVINCGIKAFERIEVRDPNVKAPYRICQEISQSMLPWIERKVETDVRVFQKMLNKHVHTVGEIDEIDTDKEAPLTKKLSNLGVGSFLLHATHERQLFVFSAFMGKDRLQLYISKDEVQTLKSQLAALLDTPVTAE